MAIVFDIAYLLLAAVTAPWWLRKRRSGWAERFGRVEAVPGRAPGGALGALGVDSGGRRLLIHAVSVGEVNLVRRLVDELLERGIDVVVAVTTDTGIARARALYADRCPVVRYPLDASWAVGRFLDAVHPDAAALVELEVWPNFIAACRKRGIPVAVVNGRLSARSFRNYRRGRLLIGRSFRRLAFVGAQDETYAGRFRAMGVAADRCRVVGTMKWDSAQTGAVEGVDAFASAMGIDRTRPVVVAGSTAPDEHELLRDAVSPDVQLVCAPRKPEWFDAAAAVLGEGCVRRSARPDGAPGESPPEEGARFLLDTIGELRKAYALADVVVVGRSFGGLYGSDPMEPAALSRAIVIGPAVDDFRETVEAMDRAGAIARTDRAGLGQVLTALLADADRRRALGERALACVREHQGASAAHAALLVDLLESGEVRDAR